MEPHIRIVTRKISPQMMPGTQTEIDAMTEVCEKFPGDEWCLADTHFVGLEPGPVVDVMFVFVKAEFYPPARAEYYLDQIGEHLAGWLEGTAGVELCVSEAGEDPADCCAEDEAEESAE